MEAIDLWWVSIVDIFLLVVLLVYMSCTSVASYSCVQPPGPQFVTGGSGACTGCVQAEFKHTTTAKFFADLTQCVTLQFTREYRASFCLPYSAVGRQPPCDLAGMGPTWRWVQKIIIIKLCISKMLIHHGEKYHSSPPVYHCLLFHLDLFQKLWKIMSINCLNIIQLRRIQA